MNLQEKLQGKIKKLPKYREVEFMGETCVTPRMTTKEKTEWQEEFAAPETSQERMAEMLSLLLLDPETEKPVFTAEYIINEMPDDVAFDMMRTVLGSAVSRAEKN